MSPQKKQEKKEQPKRVSQEIPEEMKEFDVDTPEEPVDVEPEKEEVPELIQPEGEIVEYIIPKRKPKEDPVQSNLKEAIIHVLAEMGAGATLEGIQAKLTQSIPKEEVDLDDFMEIPCLFFCYKSAFIIFGEMKNGKESLPPNGQPVRFEHTYRTKRYGRNPHEVDVYHVSTAKVYSKRVAEWLRKHTLFNITFFEKLGEATKVDVYLSEKMAEVNSMVSTWNANQIIERAKVLNIQITNDIENLRKQILVKMAQAEIQSQIRKSKDFIKKTGSLQVAMDNIIVEPE